MAAGYRSGAPGYRGWGKATGDLRRPQTRACGREPGRPEAYLSVGDFDQTTLGLLLSDFRDQVQRLANSDMQIEVIEKVSQLSVLLFSEGDRLSGEK